MLHGLDVEDFLANYWQKRPLLIRNALPGFTGFLTVDELLAQGAHEATPSRFISEAQGVLGGPFELEAEALPAAGWTVLVQSLETVFDEAWTLLDQFSFLPRARLDDVMASYAAPGGGIGPHFDLYDVFLVQGEGRRRWRYSELPLDASMDEEASGPYPFEADHDVEVGPGDILYLPPRVLHDGTGITACTTYSVGAAAPRHADLIGEFLAFLGGEFSEMHGMYTDPNARPPRRRGEVPARLIEETTGLVSRLPVDKDTVSIFLGRLLTGPKPHTDFVENDALAPEEFAAQLAGADSIRLTPPTRMLHDGGSSVFINGFAFEAHASLLELADTRMLSLPRSFDADEIEILSCWHEAGYLTLGAPPVD